MKDLDWASPLDYSPLAIAAPGMRHAGNSKHRSTLGAFGVLLHQTGRGLLARAKRRNESPLASAIDLYVNPKGYGPQYVISYRGVIVQTAAERVRAQHAGVPARQRAQYLSGSWRRKVNATALKRWEARWPGMKSPQHIYPHRSPNDAFIGIEFIPNRRGRFSVPQLRAGATLVSDILTRQHLAQFIDFMELRRGLVGCRRVCGHEDIEPLERWNRVGGWDPGALRKSPRFDWAKFGGFLLECRESLTCE